MKSTILSLALAACSSASPDYYVETQLPIEDSGKLPPSIPVAELPECVGLSPEYLDHFDKDDFGRVTAEQSVVEWLEATGREPDAIPVIDSTECPIVIHRGEVVAFGCRSGAGGCYRDGWVVISWRRSIYECSPDKPQIVANLKLILLHELGHAFGCNHPADSELMRASDGSRRDACRVVGVDAAAAECATALHVEEPNA